MPNKNYEKGRRKEYAICDRLRNQGYDIAQRTAGSHSPFDIIAVNKAKKIIKLVQVKTSDVIRQKSELEKANEDLNGNYEVEFVVE